LRKTRLGAFTALLLVLGFTGSALAAKPDEPGPGPNGHNEHGLCTAYFNGQKKGHADGSPGPFAALEEKADTSDDDEPATIQEIFNYCSGVEKGIGGNPDENGRFTDCFTNSDSDSTNDCTDG
jgi:hypothetical protein